MANKILNTPGGQGQLPAGKVFVGAKNNNGTVVNGFTNKLFVFDLSDLVPDYSIPAFDTEILSQYLKNKMNVQYNNVNVGTDKLALIYKSVKPKRNCYIGRYRFYFPYDNYSDNLYNLLSTVYNSDFTSVISDGSNNREQVSSTYYNLGNKEGTITTENRLFEIEFRNPIYLKKDTVYMFPAGLCKKDDYPVCLEYYYPEQYTGQTRDLIIVPDINDFSTKKSYTNLDIRNTIFTMIWEYKDGDYYYEYYYY
jgi:hypothetical protein